MSPEHTGRCQDLSVSSDPIEQFSDCADADLTRGCSDGVEAESDPIEEVSVSAAPPRRSLAVAALVSTASAFVAARNL